jgi:tetratricopeptide (TPR) repeat protein
MAKRKPNDLNLQIELGQGHAWLADALQKQGQLAEIRRHTETELAIYRAVLAKDPTIRQAKFSTVDALLSSGRLSMLEGNQKKASAAFSEAAERGERLLDVERENMDLTSVVASAHISLGESLLATGSVQSAGTEQQRAAALLKTALAHDDTVALWRGCRDRADLLEAAVAAARGERDHALQLDQALLVRLNNTASDKPNTDPFALLQRSRLQTGDDLAALGRSQDAKTQWTEVARSLSGPLENYEPHLLELLAAAQARLGRTTEALAVTKKLQGLFRPIAKTEASL